MRALLPLPVLLPLLGAALTILVGRSRAAQRAVALATLTAVAGVAVALLVVVDRDGVVATQAGDWAAPVGITLVADRFSAIMLLTASVMLLAVLVYAIGQPGAERNHVGFQSVYLMLAAGVSAAFLTGDLFNLFVAIEMMLTASYVLITLGGRLEQVRSGMTYVVISLVASVLFLAALAFTYAATGTVNLADLAGAVATLPGGLRAGLAGLFLVVFGIKAGLFPLYFWLPDSYPTAPSPVTAIFAGLLTKVGVYAIVRTQTLVFPGALPRWLILTVAGATMIVGVLGAIAQDDVKRILSFHIISHIGYMVMGLGVATVAGLAGTVLYTVHHILVKTTLFLTGGLIEHRGGSSRLSKLGDMVRTAPALAVLFLIPALSLAGIPPLSGFVAKLSLIDAAAAERQWPIVGVAVGVSLLTVFALMKIWTGAFWAPVEDGATAGTPGKADAEDRPTSRWGGPPLMVIPTVVLATATVVLGLLSGPVYDLSHRAAEDLVDTGAYRDAVLGPGSEGRAGAPPEGGGP
ncbi:MAG TPA: Na+/H+ antiporter subunit D [Acidimicrobiales bacterium]|nr:Na+/H+ antiporter subunit D [Acidimicrobiales bacterium]